MSPFFTRYQSVTLSRCDQFFVKCNLPRRNRMPRVGCWGVGGNLGMFVCFSFMTDRTKLSILRRPGVHCRVGSAAHMPSMPSVLYPPGFTCLRCFTHITYLDYCSLYTVVACMAKSFFCAFYPFKTRSNFYILKSIQNSIQLLYTEFSSKRVKLLLPLQEATLCD